MGRDQWTLLDVREAWELEIASIDGALHIPLGQLLTRVAELDTALPVAVLCHSGMRSGQAAQFLDKQGFKRVYNVSGGIDRWATDVDPAIARY